MPPSKTGGAAVRLRCGGNSSRPRGRAGTDFKDHHFPAGRDLAYDVHPCREPMTVIHGEAEVRVEGGLHVLGELDPFTFRQS